MRAIRLTPAGMVHYALLPGEHIAHVTVRFDADMCYYLIGKRFAITVPIRSELEQYGVNPGNLVAALNRFAAGEITDKVHLQLLIANLLSALALFLAHGQYKSMSAPEEIICNYIHENYYRNDLTIPEIARVSGFSKNYIQKVFRRSHQCTPMEYLTSVRLDSAQRLLKQHRYQVKEVAAMCGWNYPHYFCRCYRRRYGHAPSEE